MDKFISLYQALSQVRIYADACYVTSNNREAKVCERIEEKLKSIPAADVVARDCYERILAENDVMREQLAKIGKRPGNSMSDIGRIETATAENVGRDEYWGYWYRCSSCGNDNTEGSVYCSNCGRKLVY